MHDEFGINLKSVFIGLLICILGCAPKPTKPPELMYSRDYVVTWVKAYYDDRVINDSTTEIHATVNREDMHPLAYKPQFKLYRFNQNNMLVFFHTSYYVENINNTKAVYQECLANIQQQTQYNFREQNGTNGRIFYNDSMQAEVWFIPENNDFANAKKWEIKEKWGLRAEPTIRYIY